MDKRVAVVTGANRGIGLEICRQLGRRGGIRVFLTARNEEKGKAAAQKLRERRIFPRPQAQCMVKGGLVTNALIRRKVSIRR